MGTVVLDAGVVIGLLDVSDAHHRVADEAFRRHRNDDLRLPASAYAELLVQPTKRQAADIAAAAIADLGVSVDPIGQSSARAAAGLRARYRSLRLPDALVLGHAEAIGADVVLTMDHRWKRVSPRVEVV